MKKINILMLASAALLASCSQNDELQNTVSENEGLKPMTISVALPEGMTTRAVTLNDDAKDQRCFVQILDEYYEKLEGDLSGVQKMDKVGDGYTKTVYLKGNETYNFLFWADSEDDSEPIPSDLSNVPYNNDGTTNAWAGTKFDETWSATGVRCDLKHVVTRITLNTTTNFTVSEASNQTLTISVPTTYTAYNVLLKKPTGATSTYVYNCPDGEYTAGNNVDYFYVIGDGNTHDLAFHYNGPLSNPSIDIASVPIKANTHVTLKGDVANSGLTGGTITATMDYVWPNEEGKDF